MSKVKYKRFAYFNWKWKNRNDFPGTLSERPHERTEKDIPKVVSDGEINPKLHTFATAEAIRAKRRQILL